jgi:hypothetical protein
MKLTRDPVRLADLGDSAVDDLGGAVRALRVQDAASPTEIEALARRLAPQLAAPTTAGLAGAAFVVWAKWGASLLVALAIGYAAVHLARSTPVQPRPTPASRQAPQARASNSAIEIAVPAPAALAAPSSEPLASPRSAVGHSRHARIRRAVRTPPTVPAAHPEDELLLLKQAQLALDRDPSSALAFAEQHARDYPGGVFTQEREILAIEALLKLRQKTAAVTRARDFMQRYPGSPHARRVHSLLDRSHLPASETISPASDHTPDGNQH